MVTVAVPEPPASMMVLPPSHGSSSSSTGVVPGESPVAVYVCQVALVSVSMTHGAASRDQVHRSRHRRRPDSHLGLYPMRSYSRLPARGDADPDVFTLIGDVGRRDVDRGGTRVDSGDDDSLSPRGRHGRRHAHVGRLGRRSTRHRRGWTLTVMPAISAGCAGTVALNHRSRSSHPEYDPPPIPQPKIPGVVGQLWLCAPAIEATLCHFSPGVRMVGPYESPGPM